MRSPRPITGRTVLFGFIGFFGVIFAVNGAFVYFALDSWPGLRFSNAYERGLNYNKILAEAETQASLKWQSAVSVTRDAQNRVWLEARIQADDGTPVSDLKLEVAISRPTNEFGDATLNLTTAAPGIYRAQAALPAPGRWQAELHARRDGAMIYKMTHEIMIEP